MVKVTVMTTIHDHKQKLESQPGTHKITHGLVTLCLLIGAFTAIHDCPK